METGKRRAWFAVVSALVVTKLVFLFAFAFNGRFVMDEFGQLGWAKYLGHGLFDTIWPPKAVGFQLFIWPAHALGWDARSILLAGRIETLLLAFGTLALVYACARTLGQSRLRSAIVLLALLSFSNFIERIFETRAEPVALFFAAAALLAALRGPGRAKWVVAAGVLSGLSFLTTQKAVYFNVALGVALVVEALVRGRVGDSIRRSSWLVLGWAVPAVVYCLAFGPTDPVAIARNLILGPVGVASPQTAAEYGGLRHFVVQTLEQNALLYGFCLAGIVLAALRWRQLGESARIALIFTAVITILVFAHDQPWPYVFIMAQPFVALWVTEPFERLAGNRRYLAVAAALLGFAVAVSFVRNVTYLRWDNRAQLALIDRAEALVGPNDVYFDGIGMLPNRSEPSTLWLDRHFVLRTLREGRASEAYRIFANTPPKLVIWSYRMDAVAPVVAPLIGRSYVRIAPNLWIAGRQLEPGQQQRFEVPWAGDYALYSGTGSRLQGELAIDGHTFGSSVHLGRGWRMVTLRGGARGALLLPEGSYAGQFRSGPDDSSLFAGVYD